MTQDEQAAINHVSRGARYITGLLLGVGPGNTAFAYRMLPQVVKEILYTRLVDCDLFTFKSSGGTACAVADPFEATLQECVEIMQKEYSGVSPLTGLCAAYRHATD